MTDNGCQPTLERFIRACSRLGLKQIFTSFHNPKGNADTVRLMRIIKENLVWPYERENPYQFEAAFKDWVKQYNTYFSHMALGYQTPQQFSHNTLLQSA